MPREASQLRGKRRLRATAAGYLIRGLALVALAISGYLAYVSNEGGTVAGCGGPVAADCDHVLTSRWARVLGVPVAAPAVVVYGSILLLSCTVPYTGGRTKAIVETLLLTAALAVIGAAAYFFFLQIAVIGKLCLLCLAVHACGLTVGGLIVYPAVRYRTVDDGKISANYGSIALGIARTRRASSPEPVKAKPNVSFAVAASVLGLSLMIAAQILFKSKTFEVVDLDTTVSADPDGAAENNGEDRAGEDPKDSWRRSTSDEIPHRTLRMTLPNDAAGDLVKDDSKVESRAKLPQAVSGISGVSPAADADQQQPTAAAGIPSLDGSLGDMRPQFDRYLKLAGMSRAVDLTARPRLGFRSAENVVVKIFDYTCHHCRDMHGPLDRAQDRYGNQLAVVLFPMPLGKECNKFIAQQHPDHKDACRYGKLAMAVWATYPAEFGEYHEWLMHGPEVPPLGEAVQKAVAIIGRDRIRAAVNDSGIERLLQENIAVFAAVRGVGGNNGALPVVFIGRRAVFGVIAADQLFPILETQLNVQPGIAK